MLASSTGVRMHRARAWGEGQGEASAVKMGWGGLSLRTCFPPKVLKKQGNGSKITESELGKDLQDPKRWGDGLALQLIIPGG